MDLSKLSEEEIQAMIAAKSAPAAAAPAPVSALSDEELQAQIAAKTPENVLNETHPEISWADRMLVKNFGNSPDATVQYLQKEHPDFEVRLDKDMDVELRKKGEKDWRRLDPKGFDMADVTDIGYDVGAGALQGMATGAAALGGTAVGTPALGLAAGMGASGASGAALEGVRQGIGGMLGVNQEADLAQVGMAGLVGTVTPAILGTGVKGAAKGLIPKAWSMAKNEIAPRVNFILGGQNPEIAKVAAKNLKIIQQADNDPELALELGKKFHDTLDSAVQAKRQELGQALGANVEGAQAAGVEIPTASVKAPFLALRDELAQQAERAPNEINKGKLAYVDDLIERHFGSAKTEMVDAPNPRYMPGVTTEPATIQVPKTTGAAVGDVMTPLDALSMKRDLAELSEIGRSPGIIKRMQGVDVTAIDKRVASVATRANRAIDKEIKDRISGNADANKAFADFDKLQRLVGSKFSSPERTFETLRTLGGKNKKVVRGALHKLDSELGLAGTPDSMSENAKILQAISVYSDAGADALSSYGSTSTSKTGSVGFLGAEVAGAIADQLPLPGMVKKMARPLGFLAAAKSVGPASTRKIMEVNAAANAAASKIPSPLGINIPQAAASESAWNYVRDNMQKRK